MATILYFDKSVVPSFTPAFKASWNSTTGAVYGSLFFGKVFTSVAATQTSDVTGAAAVRELLITSMITPGLAAQTIPSGTIISGQCKWNMSSTTTRTGAGKVYLRVMNQDGTIASEVGNAQTTNLTTTLTNRTWSITLGTNLVLTEWQRLVFEFGWIYLTGTNTATTGSMQSVCVPAAADLPVDNTTTTTLNNWINFSNSIIIASGYAKGLMI